MGFNKMLTFDSYIIPHSSPEAYENKPGTVDNLSGA